MRSLSEVASDREAQRLAARENKADVLNGVNLGGQDQIEPVARMQKLEAQQMMRHFQAPERRASDRAARALMASG